ncbi:MAG: hypothetical protein J5858_00885 [Lentisphaeria bacterium]|nr:hypothetical protein [Lentisphaeria bacterium]
MSSFVPMRNRNRLWKCPKCGEEKWEYHFPVIHTCFPLFGFLGKAPVCPKCKTKMVEVKLFY